MLVKYFKFRFTKLHTQYDDKNVVNGQQINCPKTTDLADT